MLSVRSCWFRSGMMLDPSRPHPNPRKAAEGYRLRVLAIDEPSAEVVQRIFTEYLEGKGDRAIANDVNRTKSRVLRRGDRTRTGVDRRMAGGSAPFGRF